MPRVSVLLPCRDVAAFLPQTIASLDAQTFTDIEIIAVDDGSADDTPALLHEWAARESRVRVLARPARGIVAALQEAAAAAEGEILVRMDGDDVAHPQRIEKQVALLDDMPHVGACGTRTRYFPRDAVQGGALRYEAWINSLLQPHEIARDIFVECPIAHPTLAIRRDLFDQVGGYRDRGWPEDYDLVLRLWSHGVAMAKTPEVLLDWRERPERASRQDPQYAEHAFRRCKVHYLTRTLLPTRDGVVVWGAGPVGKLFARELQRQDARVRAFVDLDPRKIGQIVHGAPVVSPRDVQAYRDALCVAAVGQPDARAEIRAALDELGWIETQDYVVVA